MAKFPRTEWFGLWILLVLLLAACLGPAPTATASIPTLSLTATPTPIPPTLTAAQTATFTPIPSATATPEPLGCQKPPEDYTRIDVNNGQIINSRTLAMLSHAQRFYGGELELTGSAITQGSY